MVEAVVADIDTVNQHRALVGIVQARDHRDQRCFAAAGGADDADGGTGGNVQIDMIQHGFFAVLIIAEGDVFKPDVALLYGACVIRCRIGDVRDLIQNLGDTLCRCHRTGHLHKHHRDHHQRGQNLRDVCNKCGEVTCRHGLGHKHIAAEPEYRQRGDIHKERHDRGHKDHDTGRCHTALFQLCIGPGKLVALKRFAHKRLDNADIGQVFLHRCVQSVDFGLHCRKAREAAGDDQRNGADQKRHDNRQYQRQAQIDRQRHDQRTDHHAGGTQAHAEQRHDEVLHLGNVIGQTGDQRRGGELVDVGKRVGLYLAVDIFPQVCRKVDGGLGAVVRAADTADHHDNGGDNHTDHRGDDERRCIFAADGIDPADKAGGLLDRFCTDTVVDDHGQRFGHQHFADDLNDHAKRSEDEIRPIGLDIFQPAFQV